MSVDIAEFDFYRVLLSRKHLNELVAQLAMKTKAIEVSVDKDGMPCFDICSEGVKIKHINIFERLIKKAFEYEKEQEQFEEGSKEFLILEEKKNIALASIDMVSLVLNAEGEEDDQNNRGDDKE